MSHNFSRNKKITILTAIFLFALLLRLWNLYDVGRTYDEEAYVKPGYQFIELIKKGDFGNTLWWEAPDEPPFARYLYGITAQFDVIKNNHIQEPTFNYDFRFSRLVSVLFSSLAVVLITAIGLRYVSVFVGICAGIIFAMLPFSLGFSQLATLESLIMFFFTANIFLFLSLLEKYSMKKVLTLGILFGLAASVKVTNILVFPLFLLMYAVWFFCKGKKKHIEILNKQTYALLYIGILGIITFFVIWPMPWFHLDHVARYLHQLRFSTHLSIPEVFFGKLHLAPVYYYAVLFLITTPAIVLLLFSVGLIEVKKTKKWIFYLFVLWFFFPFIQSFYHMRQQGVRYIIEIYAPLSLIAAIGFDSTISAITKNTLKKLVCLIPLIIYLFILLARITPYYTNYFNELIGGAGGVYRTKLFQLGWWGEGTKEAVVFLENIAPPYAIIGIVERQLRLAPPTKTLKIVPYTDNRTFDYVILHYYNILREGFDDKGIKKKYVLIHCVKADGACLIAIYKKK